VASQGAEPDTDDEPQPELAPHEQRQVHDPVAARALDPLDQADRERDRHRVVAARLGLERARDPPADVGEAQGREDRRRVGGGDDGAEQHRLQPGEVEEDVRRRPRDDGADADADGREQRCGHRDLA
jgi:hypothetical protein